MVTQWQPLSWTSMPGWSTSFGFWPKTVWESESPALCQSGPGLRMQVWWKQSITCSPQVIQPDQIKILKTTNCDQQMTYDILLLLSQLFLCTFLKPKIFMEVWTRSLLCSSWCSARRRGWRGWKQIWTGHHMGGKWSVLCCSLLLSQLILFLYPWIRSFVFHPISKGPALCGL